ncbi:MAG: phosphatidylethanolamine-binding protein [Monoraphidium minutum]|nr:MAG: phosphatidylethanolamine-binding protein [Monoraphidium minutum]
MKSEEKIRADAPTSISSYPDLIPDSAVVFAASKLVPEVGDTVALDVSLAGGKAITNGTLVSGRELLEEPRVKFSRSRPEDIYSLVMVDPDFPTPSAPKLKDVLLWMVTNIKGGALEGADFPVEYMPEEPGQGVHRLAFLVYRQPGYQNIEPPAKRASFQTKQWAKSHQWGDPVGGIFCKASHE